MSELRATPNVLQVRLSHILAFTFAVALVLAIEIATAMAASRMHRRYILRWQILQRHAFDPEADIIRDSQRLYQLAGNKIGLRDDLRAYFRARDEDGISP